MFTGLSEIGEILGEGRRYLTEVQWEWQSNEGEWREYAPTESRMIEVGVTSCCVHTRVGQYFNKSPISHKQVLAIPLSHVFCLHNIIA